MSAAELITRYGIEEPVAGFIMTDINSAIQHNQWAVEFRADGLSGAFGPYQYGRLTGEQYFRAYRGHARAIGWKVSQIIDTIVRAEEAAADTIVANHEAGFLSPACADETCEDCERPLWHHIAIVGAETLCPFGRRYWQIARALMPSVMGKDRSDDRMLLSVLARRA